MTQDLITFADAAAGMRRGRVSARVLAHEAYQVFDIGRSRAQADLADRRRGDGRRPILKVRQNKGLERFQ